MVKVQPRGGGRYGQREVVDVGRLPGELHAVVDRGFPVLGQHQMRVNIAEVFGHRQVESHSLPGGNCPERGFAGGVEAVVECVGHKSLPFMFSVKPSPEGEGGRRPDEGRHCRDCL